MNTVNDSEVGRISKIFEHLVTEGFRPEMASETSVKVKYQGVTLYVDIAENDKSFYSIICAYIWEIESEQELLGAYKAASNTAMSMKVAKAFVTRDEKNVWVVMEQFFPEVEQFLPTVGRLHMRRIMSYYEEKIRPATDAMRPLQGKDYRRRRL